jgi:hypothetical protein
LEQARKIFYLVPHSRLPQNLPRLAAFHRVRLAQDPQRTLHDFIFYRKSTSDGFILSVLGALDGLLKIRSSLEDKFITALLEKAFHHPVWEVRQKAYQAGLLLKGKEFIQPGLQDESLQIRRWTEKILKSKYPYHPQGGRPKKPDPQLSLF